MTKKRSIVKLCIIAVLTLIGLVLTFVSFIIPTTTTTFNGFFKAINYGYDVSGGYVAIYKPADSSITGYELERNVQETVTKLNSSLNGLGFQVTKQDKNIRVEISKVSYYELNDRYSVDVFGLLGVDRGIEFSSSSDAGSLGEDFISGSHITKVSYAYAGQINSDGSDGWVINVEFDEEGASKFKALTQKIADDNGKLYMYMNGEDASNGGYEMTSGVSSLTLTTTTESSARAMSLQLSTLSKPLILNTLIDGETTAGLNSSSKFFFGNESNLILFAIAIIFIASVIFLSVRYRILGAMASVSILIFTILYTFFLQSIPLVLLDFSGIMGVLATYGLLIAGFVTCFEKIKKEYIMGKKIPNAVTSGFRKTILKTLEQYCILLVVSAIFYLVGIAGLKTFAVSLFIGLFINFFTIYVVTRGLCKIYLPINSSNKKLYNLKREATKDEV